MSNMTPDEILKILDELLSEEEALDCGESAEEEEAIAERGVRTGRKHTEVTTFGRSTVNSTKIKLISFYMSTIGVSAKLKSEIDWNGFLTASATRAAFCSGVDTRLLPEPGRRCPSLENCELLIQGRRYSKQPGKSRKKVDTKSNRLRTNSKANEIPTAPRPTGSDAADQDPSTTSTANQSQQKTREKRKRHLPRTQETSGLIIEQNRRTQSELKGYNAVGRDQRTAGSSFMVVLICGETDCDCKFV
ncbi:hypothetical protein C0J52_22492 [Blattella germanica]|nr:hypothetical protein C0J52_22492 [Blattella germanica]